MQMDIGKAVLVESQTKHNGHTGETEFQEDVHKCGSGSQQTQTQD